MSRYSEEVRLQGPIYYSGDDPSFGISTRELLREMTTIHLHDFSANWGQPGHCYCGGWQELVDVLEAIGLPAAMMSMDPLLRQAAGLRPATRESRPAWVGR